MCVGLSSHFWVEDFPRIDIQCTQKWIKNFHRSVGSVCFNAGDCPFINTDFISKLLRFCLSVKLCFQLCAVRTEPYLNNKRASFPVFWEKLALRFYVWLICLAPFSVVRHQYWFPFCTWGNREGSEQAPFPDGL